MSSVHEKLNFTQSKKMLASKQRCVTIHPVVSRMPECADSARSKTTQSDAVMGGEVITFRIPQMKRCFIDQKNSLLKFSCGVYNYSNYNKVVDGVGTDTYEAYYMALDGSCASLFQKFEVTQGGRILESINEIGQVYSILMDGGLTYDNRESSLNVLMGSTSSAVVASNTTLRNGKTWTTGAFTGLSSTEFTRNSTTTFAMPLIGGLLGIFANKYLPIDTLEAPIEFHLTLAPLRQAFLYRVTTFNWTEQYHWMNNFTLELSVIELSQEVFNSVQKTHNGLYYIQSESFRCHSELLPNVREHTIHVPDARFKGLQRVFVCLYYKNFRTDTNTAGTTSRRLYKLSECQFRHGQKYYPERPIECNITSTDGLDVYYHMLRCFRSYDNMMFSQNCLDSENFFTTMESPYLGSTGPNSNIRAGGLVAYNFQSFEDPQLYNGIDTSDESMPLMINMKFSADHSNDFCFVFLNYDMEIKVENGRYTIFK